MKKSGLYILLVAIFSWAFAACSGPGKEETVTEAFTPQEFERLIKEHEAVVVDFKADWCGPCKILGPSLEKVAEEFKGKVKLQKVDVDLSPELAKQMGIQGIPYVVKYVKGQKVNEMTGVAPEETVRKFFEEGN